MKVWEIMKQDVKACRLEDHLNVPARVMWENDCGSVPVVDDDSRVVGMVTDRDMAMACYIQNQSPSSIPVSSAMSKAVFTCRREDDLERVEKLMQDKQVRRIPVTDQQGRLAGIISLGDLARALQSARKTDVSERDIALTLSSISQPHAPRRSAPSAS